ncbi:hypothetical protein Bca4012_030349 [Brassica carinata]|uniref:ubiquitinyl hydrolase 1 n=2 Tax=Brassica TaxID=3705 RepID=A0A0D3BUG2_BRAOL|nr:PREDICTED: OTU domain-containing protein 5-like isoform X2 [Brassica oleracea var. oleracea]KAG2288733.1 hypothetical protein Bca52824_048337 [Brassica carinata]
MARILVQRGSSSNASHRSTPSSSASATEPPPVTVYEETTDEVNVVEEEEEEAECSDAKDVSSLPSDEPLDREDDDEGLVVSENAALVVVEGEGVDCDSLVSGGDVPDSPPLPVPPPPKPSSNRRSILGSFGDLQIGATRRGAGPRSLVSTRGSPTGSHPSSPRSQSENEGYNSSDEHTPSFTPSHAGSGSEREHQFETEIRQSKGFEIRRMLEDGNCLFRAVADQVYGDSESYDLTRQMCMDYMEHERDHFSQFITEGFTSYLKRKRRDKVYGNNVEIQALAEMYNRPIHIYSYSTEPINIFQGSYNTDTPPIRLSYHHGNHYNSLVDPHRLTVGAGLGFSSLTGRQVDGEQVKAAIKAQQEHQIDNALIAEGRYYSDLELTEKEIERSVMEASRAEYLMERSKPRIGPKESSTSNAGTSSSSGARTSGSDRKPIEKTVLSSSIEMVLSMGFSYTQAIEAYSIFGDDVDSMVCYVLETSCGSKNRRKGKATE